MSTRTRTRTRTRTHVLAGAVHCLGCLMSPPPCVCASLALRGRIFSTQAIAWRAPCSSADRRAFVSSRARHAVIRCTQSSRQYPDHTPFAEAVIHRKVGEPPSDEVLELNVENADKVLDEVRADRAENSREEERRSASPARILALCVMCGMREIVRRFVRFYKRTVETSKSCP